MYKVLSSFYILYDFIKKMSESQIGGIIGIPVCREPGLERGGVLSDKHSNLNIRQVCTESLGTSCETVSVSALRQIQISPLIISKTSRDITFCFSVLSFLKNKNLMIDGGQEVFFHHFHIWIRTIS